MLASQGSRKEVGYTGTSGSREVLRVCCGSSHHWAESLGMKFSRAQRVTSREPAGKASMPKCDVWVHHLTCLSLAFASRKCW